MRVCIYAEYTHSLRTLSAIAVASALIRRGISVRWFTPQYQPNVEAYWDDHVRHGDNHMTPVDCDTAIFFGNTSQHYRSLRSKIRSRTAILVPDAATLKTVHLSAFPSFDTIVMESPESASQLRQLLLLRQLSRDNVRSCRFDATVCSPVVRDELVCTDYDPALCFYVIRGVIRERGAWLMECVEALATTPVPSGKLPIHVFCETAPGPRLLRQLEACPDVQCYFSVPFDRLFSTLAKMSFFVLGAPHPGSGLIIRTAMSQGAIPVCPAIRSFRRMLNDRVDSLLIPTISTEVTDINVERGLLEPAVLSGVIAAVLNDPPMLVSIHRGVMARSNLFDPADEQFSRWWVDQVLGFRPAKV